MYINWTELIISIYLFSILHLNFKQSFEIMYVEEAVGRTEHLPLKFYVNESHWFSKNLLVTFTYLQSFAQCYVIVQIVDVAQLCPSYNRQSLGTSDIFQCRILLCFADNWTLLASGFLLVLFPLLRDSFFIERLEIFAPRK